MPQLFAEQLITLQTAENLGYGLRDTLQKAVLGGKLKALKPGRDYLTTEEWLKEAGYRSPLQETR